MDPFESIFDMIDDEEPTTGPNHRYTLPDWMTELEESREEDRPEINANGNDSQAHDGMSKYADHKEIQENLSSRVEQVGYYKDLVQKYSEELDLFLRPYGPNLLIRHPPSLNATIDDFVGVLSEFVIRNSGTRRSVSQSFLKQTFYEEGATQKDITEFYYAPIRVAHFYNYFSGVYVINIPDTYLSNPKAKELGQLVEYVRDQSDIRFVFSVSSDEDCDGLQDILSSARSVVQIILPTPGIASLVDYARCILDGIKTDKTSQCLAFIEQFIQKHDILDFETIKVMSYHLVWCFENKKEVSDDELYRLFASRKIGKNSKPNTIGF